MSKPRDLNDQLVAALNFRGIDTVVDVGANRGQYAQKLRLHGYTGTIRSIEPIAELNAQLVEMARNDLTWIVEPPLAVGDRDGEISFHRSNESDMSSVLPQTEMLETISPSSKIVETFSTPLRRLDSFYARGNGLTQQTFVKLDVQGFEPSVIDGMTDLWPVIQGMQLEMALVELYQGEMLWKDVITRLEQLGYGLAMLLPGYYERKLGRQLQVDGIFFKDLGTA